MFGTGFSIAISQFTPPFIGRPIAALISFLLSLRYWSAVVRSARLNQWMAGGKNYTARELSRQVRQVYLHQGRSLYDFYHNLDRPEAIRSIVRLSPKFAALVEDCKKGHSPTLLLVPHLSGFNPGGLLLALYELKFLTLGIANPTKDYEWQNRIRNDRGMEVVPLTPSTLRMARERLQHGGTVLTGIDRPIDEPKYRPIFFDSPSSLPVAYVRLAMHNKARVFVVGFMAETNHKFLIDVSDQVLMEPDDDPGRELTRNAEKVLAEAEKFIRKDPSHWMMFLPVWPDKMGEVP